jgi:hypothetical protein
MQFYCTAAKKFDRYLSSVFNAPQQLSIQRSQFVALLRNENPTTGKRLTAGMNTSRQEDGETISNRQVGYGLVFGVPK